MAMTKLRDGSAITPGVEEITGKELSCLKDAHEKFASVQEDSVRSDPGKSLAWLVLFQVMLYYLCTSIISTVTYLILFAFIYVKYIYPASNAKDNGDLEEDVLEAEEEPEWFLDQFFCYVQQHKKEDDIYPSLNKETELIVPEVEEEPEWLLDRFLSYVQQHKQCKAVDKEDKMEEDADRTDHGTSSNVTQESLRKDQSSEDSKENSNNVENISDTDNLDFVMKTRVPVVSMVTSSVTNITNTISSDMVKDDTELDVDDFEIINSDDLKI